MSAASLPGILEYEGGDMHWIAEQALAAGGFRFRPTMPIVWMPLVCTGVCSREHMYGWL